MIDRTHPLPIARQCRILELARSTAYYTLQPVSPEDLMLMRPIDELHLEYPEFPNVNHKRVYRLYSAAKLAVKKPTAPLASRYTERAAAPWKTLRRKAPLILREILSK